MQIRYVDSTPTSEVTPVTIQYIRPHFDLETSKVKVMSEVKSEGHILYPVSNQCISPFVSHQLDQPILRYGQNSVWPWKKHPKFFKTICQNNSFQQNFSYI